MTAQITQARLVHSGHIYLLRRQWSLANVIQNNIICKEIQSMRNTIHAFKVVTLPASPPPTPLNQVQRNGQIGAVISHLRVLRVWTAGWSSWLALPIAQLRGLATGPVVIIWAHTERLKYLTNSCPIITSYISSCFKTQASGWQPAQKNRASKSKEHHCKSSKIQSLASRSSSI